MRASLKKKLNVARLPTFEQFLFGTNHDWTTVNLIGYDPKNLACSYVSDLKNFEQLSVTARVANLTSKNDVSLQLFLIAKSLTTDWTKQSLSKSFLASLFDYGRNDPFAYVRAFSRLSDSQKIATLIGLNSTNRYAQCACYIAESITSWTEVELGEVLTQPMVVETYRRNTDTWDQMFDRLSKKNAIEALSHLTLDEIKAIIGKSQFVWTDQQLRELEQKKGLVGTYTPIRDCARQWGKLTTP